MVILGHRLGPQHLQEHVHGQRCGAPSVARQEGHLMRQHLALQRGEEQSKRQGELSFTRLGSSILIIK